MATTWWGERRERKTWVTEQAAEQARAARAAKDTDRVRRAAYFGANIARALMAGDEHSFYGWRRYREHLDADADLSISRDPTLRRLLSELERDPRQISTRAETVAFADRWMAITEEPGAAWAFAGGMRRRAVEFDDRPRVTAEA